MLRQNLVRHLNQRHHLLLVLPEYLEVLVRLEYLEYLEVLVLLEYLEYLEYLVRPEYLVFLVFLELPLMNFQ